MAQFRVVWHWILHAFLESAFVSVLTLYLLQNYDATYHGVFASHMEAGAVAFTTIVIAVNMKVRCQSSCFHISFS